MAAQGYYDANGIWHSPGEDASGNTPTAGDGPITNTPGPPPPTIDPTPAPPAAGSAPVVTPPNFSAPDWTSNTNLPPIPGYTPPPAFQFHAPSIEEAMQEPGYQLRRNQGLDGLQRWAAYRGTLNDTGTANALIDYSQNAASQEYQNVWNRDWSSQSDTYKTNVQSQYTDPYNFALRGWEDNSAALLHVNDQNYQRAWNSFLEQMREFEAA